MISWEIREITMIKPRDTRSWAMNVAEYAYAIAASYWSVNNVLRPVEIRVDVTGIGAGLFDKLREMGLPVTAFSPVIDTILDPRS